MSAPIRLLKVVPTLMCGGTESQFMALGRSLPATRFELEFACLRRSGGFVNEIVERCIPLREYHIATFWSSRAMLQQARLARHIVRRRIQIVHAYSFYGNVFAVPPARLAGAPVIIASIRDCGPYLTPLQKRVQRYVCQFADCVLVNADAVKDWLETEGYDPANIVVVRNGVDLTRFRPPTESARIRRELGVSAGAPLVAVISRLSRLKGLEDFLQAAALVVQRFPRAMFLIAGEAGPMDPAYRDELVGLAGRLGLSNRVIFAGLESDVPDLLASVTISVMPSLTEALSNVVLESLAAGVPLVATRVGGTPEAIEDGINGLLVSPGSHGELSKAICRLLEDPQLARRLSHAGRDTVRKRFSIERMVSATERVYDFFLERRYGTMTKRVVLPHCATATVPETRAEGSTESAAPLLPPVPVESFRERNGAN